MQEGEDVKRQRLSVFDGCSLYPRPKERGFTERWIKVANEIIEDERKKNHGILADELRMIINNGSSFTSKGVSALAPIVSNGKEREPALYEIIYPDKMLSDVVLTVENRAKIDQVIREFSNWDVLMSNGVYPTRVIGKGV